MNKSQRAKVHGKIQNLLLLTFTFAFLFFTFAFASVSGQFYPANKAELSKAIDGYLKNYKVIRGEGELISIIVPHAGYEYSGSIAGYAYKQLTNKDYDTVVIIGPSHYEAFDGISVIPSGEYSTPLGSVKIDAGMAAKMMSYSPKIAYVKQAWDKEHSVEVQIPFLQKTLKNFKIVPLVIGSQTLDSCYILANAIKKSMGSKKVLIVASTDLSHYHTAETAASMDAVAIDAISKGDIDLLAQKLSTQECEMCGYGAVLTAMIIADNLGANSYEILKYGDTGDVTGDKTSVVGYLSAAIYKRPLELDEIERSTLLDIARKTLNGYINTSLKPEISVDQKDLQQKSGVFVTLIKNSQLRGCIGYVKPVKPLYMAVSDMTIAAATEDIRFSRVASEELSEINIEISVLSPMEKVSNTLEVVIGKHGLMITSGDKLGVLLPQVATENKWTRQEFLDNVCYKAEVPVSAINDPATQLYKFTVDVFKED